MARQIKPVAALRPPGAALPPGAAQLSLKPNTYLEGVGSGMMWVVLVAVVMLAGALLVAWLVTRPTVATVRR